MASGVPPAEWFNRAPSAFEIVTCRYPESKPEPGGPKLRPAIILSVLRDRRTGMIGAEVAYGTTNLRTMQRSGRDLIIQNATDLAAMGLPRATRFNLDHPVILPWCSPHFDCWSGFSSPVLGQLTEEYAKDLAWIMYKRGEFDN